MITIGLDVGNGSIGMAVAVPEGTVVSNTYPSVFAAYSGTTGVPMPGRTTVMPADVFTFENRDYVLGYESIQLASATPIGAFDREDRLYRREFQTLTKLALLDAATMATNDDIIEVNLVLGAPVEDFTPDKIGELKRWFTQPVVGAKNGRQIVVRLRDVEVISQPAAVLMDAYLNDQGYVADEAIAHGRVLVIDSGSGTLDLTDFEELKILRQFSDPVGMNDVYRTLMEVIQAAEPKARVNLYDLEHQLRRQDHSPHTVYQFGRFHMDLTDARTRAMNDTWEHMVDAISTRFPDRLVFSRVLLAGGAGDAFRSYFQSWMPAIEAVSEPQLAVARGLCKYGVLLWAEVPA